MMFKTHLVFGFLLGLILLKYVHPANQILFAAFVVAASILPDIDHPGSKIGRHFKIIGFLFEHRGFFHSVFALALFSLPVYYFINSWLGAAVCLGYFSHLLIDCVSYQGIMPLHPLSRTRIKGFIKTNSIAEFIIFVIVTAFALYMLIKL